MIFLGADHAGYKLKELVKIYLEKKGATVVDLGTDSTAAVDYPDIAKRVALKVRAHSTHRGLLFCGSGVGVSMAANKFSGIRAASSESVATAKMARKDENANVLCLGGRVLQRRAALKVVDAFLKEPFSRAIRHQRRIQKIKKIEKTKR